MTDDERFSRLQSQVVDLAVDLAAIWRRVNKLEKPAPEPDVIAAMVSTPPKDAVAAQVNAGMAAMQFTPPKDMTGTKDRAGQFLCLATTPNTWYGPVVRTIGGWHHGEKTSLGKTHWSIDEAAITAGTWIAGYTPATPDRAGQVLLRRNGLGRVIVGHTTGNSHFCQDERTVIDEGAIGKEWVAEDAPALPAGKRLTGRKICVFTCSSDTQWTGRLGAVHRGPVLSDRPSTGDGMFPEVEDAPAEQPKPVSLCDAADDQTCPKCGSHHWDSGGPLGAHCCRCDADFALNARAEQPADRTEIALTVREAETTGLAGTVPLPAEQPRGLPGVLVRIHICTSEAGAKAITAGAAEYLHKSSEKT